MQSWATELSNSGLKRDAGEFLMSRVASYERLTRLGLPTVPYVWAPLEQFLTEPTVYIARLRCESVRAIVEPDGFAHGLPTIRKTQPNLNTLTSELRQEVPSCSVDRYSILLKEFIPEAIGGTFLIGSDGSIVAEFSNLGGTSIQLDGIPAFRMWRDPFLDCFRYSFDDPTMRKRIFDALQEIPHTGRGRDAQFKAGYYEAILARREGESGYTLYFDDYRTGKGFGL
jgi:hypothetical protein